MLCLQKEIRCQSVGTRKHQKKFRFELNWKRKKTLLLLPNPQRKENQILLSQWRQIFMLKMHLLAL
jgi:hypothetical protein